VVHCQDAPLIKYFWWTQGCLETPARAWLMLKPWPIRKDFLAPSMVCVEHKGVTIPPSSPVGTRGHNGYRCLEMLRDACTVQSH
jgi:hypothetical protein